jgi:ketosteroid isomerase-like protein
MNVKGILARIDNATTFVVHVDQASLRGMRKMMTAVRPGDDMQHTETAAASDLAALLELNQDYIRSVQTSNVERFKEILADDFLCSLPDGSLIDRSRFLQQTAQPVQISNLTAHDVNVRLMGDFAIIHARTTYTAADGQLRSGRYTDVWARRSGRWLAVSAHVTRN